MGYFSMTEAEKIGALIDQCKQDIIWLNTLEHIVGIPRPDTLMEQIFDELANRSSMLCASWFDGDVTMHHIAYDRATVELKSKNCMPRETFIKSLLEGKN